MKTKERININPAAENSATEKRFTVDALCYLFLIFLSGCLVGWIYEEIFYTFTEGMLRNRGILYGPWLPIYGLGALCIYAMKPLRKNPVLLFTLCVVITGVVEYVIGYVGINFFHIRLWDYRNLFLNIGGIICFRSVVSFGLLGLFFHYVLEPLSYRLYKRLNPAVIHAVCAGIAAVFLIDCVVSAIFRTPISY